MGIKIIPKIAKTTKARSATRQCRIFIIGAIMKKPAKKINPDMNQSIFMI
jgi:Asp-tRNA(Asn)/Glu-tRNA(Gln) amidotransferase B subunit